MPNWTFFNDSPNGGSSERRAHKSSTARHISSDEVGCVAWVPGSSDCVPACSSRVDTCHTNRKRWQHRTGQGCAITPTDTSRAYDKPVAFLKAPVGEFGKHVGPTPTHKVGPAASDIDCSRVWERQLNVTPRCQTPRWRQAVREGIARAIDARKCQEILPREVRQDVPAPNSQGNAAEHCGCGANLREITCGRPRRVGSGWIGLAPQLAVATSKGSKGSGCPPSR